MKPVAIEAKLVELVQDAILAEVASGKLPAGSSIAQDQVAQALGVSRPTVQQALLALADMGVLREDSPGRGLRVAPLDLDHVRNIYDVRAVLEGLAFRKAAERNPKRAEEEGPDLIRAGRRAVASGKVADMIEADMAFHEFVYALSENPHVAPAMERHLTSTQRVMGEVLMRDEKPRDVWDQHEAMLQAIIAADPVQAEELARRHVEQSADFMIERLRRENPAA